MAAMKQVPITCSGHTRPVVDLFFSESTPFGYFIISACKDGLPMLRQGSTGDWVGTFEGHKGAVWAATLNPNATLAATAAADYTAKLWDAEIGDETHTFTHNHIVKSVAFSPDSLKLLTGSNEKCLKLFDLSKPEAGDAVFNSVNCNIGIAVVDPLLFKGHTSAIKGAIFNKDGTSVISASDDKTIRFWDSRSQECTKQLTFSSTPSSIQLIGDKLVVTHNNTVAFYDVTSQELVKEFVTPTVLYSASYLPEKELFVCGGEDFKMYKYSYTDGTEIESVKGHFGPIHCVMFSPDGELYASGSEDGTLRLWQTEVGKTYGLWKYDEGVPTEDSAADISNPAQTASEVVAAVANGLEEVRVGA